MRSTAMPPQESAALPLQHAGSSTFFWRPAERHDDKKINRRIFQKINAVGEQRDRPNAAGYGKLDEKIGQIG